MMLIVEQALNGLQYGMMLFLLAAGLTLIFGVMGIINLAHGSFYMIGAFAAASLALMTGSFVLGILAGLAAGWVVGVVMEYLVIRRLYARHHLDQVLATFAIVMIINQSTALVFGHQPLYAAPPSWLDGSVELVPGLRYPLYRIAIILLGLVIAIGLHLLINKTRLGMLVRAGATHRDMVRALGVDIRLLYTTVFGLGALLAALSGVIAAPLLAVQIGMGEQILIIAFVVVVIGGVGSVRGAFFGALVVGSVDTLLRAFLPGLLRHVLVSDQADALAAGLSAMGVYLLMALVLLARPQGLFSTVRTGISS